MPARSSGRAPRPASSSDGRSRLQVLITRPRPQALELARRLEAQGDTALIEPLLTIERIPDAVPDLAGVQAILLTSANAVPALSEAARRLPVFAVGAATAAAAQEAGCVTVVSAEGAGADLARLVVRRCRPDAGALLHLAGEKVRPEPAAALAAAGFALRRHAVYRAAAARALSAGHGRGAPPAGGRRGAAVLAAHGADLRPAGRRAWAAGQPGSDRGDLPQRRRRRGLPRAGLAGDLHLTPPGTVRPPGGS